MSLDTSPDIATRRIAALSALSPLDRLREAIDMSNVVSALAEAGRKHRERTQAPNAASSKGA